MQQRRSVHILRIRTQNYISFRERAERETEKDLSAMQRPTCEILNKQPFEISLLFKFEKASRLVGNKVSSQRGAENGKQKRKGNNTRPSPTTTVMI